jgi:hypothetical protein
MMKQIKKAQKRRRFGCIVLATQGAKMEILGKSLGMAPTSQGWAEPSERSGRRLEARRKTGPVQRGAFLAPILKAVSATATITVSDKER